MSRYRERGAPGTLGTDAPDGCEEGPPGPRSPSRSPAHRSACRERTPRPPGRARRAGRTTPQAPRLTSPAVTTTAAKAPGREGDEAQDGPGPADLVQRPARQRGRHSVLLSSGDNIGAQRQAGPVAVQHPEGGWGRGRRHRRHPRRPARGRHPDGHQQPDVHRRGRRHQPELSAAAEDGRQGPGRRDTPG